MNESFSLVAYDQVAQATIKDLGVSIDEDFVMRQLPFAGQLSNMEIIIASIAGRRVMPRPTRLGPIATTEVLRVIEENFLRFRR